jgi:hypothetical protein
MENTPKNSYYKQMEIISTSIENLSIMEFERAVESHSKNGFVMAFPVTKPGSSAIYRCHINHSEPMETHLYLLFPLVLNNEKVFAIGFKNLGDQSAVLEVNEKLSYNPFNRLADTRDSLPNINKICQEKEHNSDFYKKIVEYTKNHPCSRCGKDPCPARKGRF